MRFDTIITHGNIHTAERSFKGDIGITGEKITAVAEAGGLTGTHGTRVLNARGKDVIPGCIDVHVHLALPFCGTVSCDDFNYGSRAAASGCITMVIDFAIPGAGQSLADAHDTWMQKADGISMIDYSWHMAITNKKHIREIPKLVSMGLPTFKEFMIYESEGWNSDDAMLFATLESVKRHDAMLLLHAESSRVLDLLIERNHKPAKMKKFGAKLHAMTRPNFVEAEAIERAIHWCDATGGTLYIVHMSTGEGADLVKAAQARGVNVLAETCVQYLVLDDSVFNEKDGHLYACCPQVKKKKDIRRLWQAIESDGDEVCVVSTDTCSFTREQKGMWYVGKGRDKYGDWTKIPMGMPGLDTMVPLMYTLGVMDGRISINRMVELCSTAPARVMGMGDQKGQIAPGYDADIAIIDPKHTAIVNPKKLQSATDWNPFEGMELGGFAHSTFVRGTPIIDRYKVVGQNGHGKRVMRSNPGSV